MRPRDLAATLRRLWIGAPGICRFCGCSEFDACVADDGVDAYGCHWIDRGRRVCSVCAPAAKAEGTQLRAQRAGGQALTPEWVRAYHLGFVVGWFAVTPVSPYGRNPFSRGVGVTAWPAGHLAGAEARRVQVTTFGSVENTPRRAVLAAARPGAPGATIGRRVRPGAGRRSRRVWRHGGAR